MEPQSKKHTTSLGLAKILLLWFTLIHFYVLEPKSFVLTTSIVKDFSSYIQAWKCPKKYSSQRIFNAVCFTALPTAALVYHSCPKTYR